MYLTLKILLTLLMLVNWTTCASVSVKTISNGNNVSGENSMAKYVQGLGNSFCTMNGVFCYDSDNSIRKIDDKGFVRTVVGVFGQEGYNGEGMEGRNTLITRVTIECDESTGSIYFIDRSNYLVRKLDKNGYVYNIAGTPNVQDDTSIGPLNNVTFSSLSKISLGPNGDVYVLDSNKIKLISQQKNQVSIVLEFDEQVASNIGGFVVNPFGDIYFTLGQRIVLYNHSQTNGNLTYLNDDSPDPEILYRDGPLQSAYFSYVTQMSFVKGKNSLLVSDFGAYRIRMVDLNINNVSTILDRDNAGEYLYTGSTVAISWFDTLNNFLYFETSRYDVIRKLNLNTGTTEIVLGWNKGIRIGGSYQETVIYSKNGAKLQVNKDGSFYALSDSSIIEFSNGTSKSIFETGTVWPNSYRKIAKSSKNEFVMAVKNYSPSMDSFSYFKKISNNGKQVVNMTATSLQARTLNNTVALNTYLGEIHSMAIDPTNGDIYYSTDVSINRVRDGIITSIYYYYNASLSYNSVLSIAFSATGEMYFSDYSSISRLNKTGEKTIIVGTPLIDMPLAMAINPINGQLYFLDQNSLLRIYNFKTKSLTTVPDTKFSGAQSLAFDDSNGDLYIGDRHNCLVHVLRANGTLSVFVGVQYKCETTVGELTSETSITEPLRVAFSKGSLIIVNGAGYTHGEIVMITNNVVSIVATASEDFYDGNTLKDARFSVFNYPTYSPLTQDLYFVDGQGWATNKTRRIRKIDKDGIVSTVAGGFGEGYSSNNSSICLSYYGTVSYDDDYFGNFDFNSKDELIYFDMAMQVMRKIDTNNIVTTIAGNGKTHFSEEDGKKGTDISLQYYQQAFTICPDDSIYYCANNDTIYKLGTDGIVNKVYDLDFELPIGSNLTCTKYGTLLTFFENTIYKVTNSLTPIRSNITEELENLPIISITVSRYNNAIYLLQSDGQVIKTIGCEENYEMQDDFETCIYTLCDDGCLNGECELGKCKCQDGWTGNRCETPICYGKTGDNACGGPLAGVCKSPDTCNCLTGYYSSNCSSFDCYGVSKDLSTVCSGNGKCTAPNQCSCFTGFSGERCYGLNESELIAAVVVPVVVVAILGIILAIVMIILCIVCSRRKKKKQNMEFEMKP